jgi:hypothetical protein
MPGRLLFSPAPCQPVISKFLGDAPGVTDDTVDQHVDILKSTGDIVIAVPKPNDQSRREKLIRRRWRGRSFYLAQVPEHVHDADIEIEVGQGPPPREGPAN